MKQRDIITLDFDTIPAYGTDNIISRLDALQYGYYVYSTRKHRPEAPRLRIVMPLARTATPEECEAVSRMIAAQIGIQMADPTTFEACRMFFWQSMSADSERVARYADRPFVPVDAILSLLGDWRDVSKWPTVPGAQNTYKKLAVKQGDPLSKKGVVGAFCTTHGIRDCIENIIPGVYQKCDTDDERYTYLGGSTSGGAIIYEDDKFLYSHHATDPCGGKLVNAFDLVRLHKFADLDDSAPIGTPVNRLPSYDKMCEFAVADRATATLLAQRRTEAAAKDFAIAAASAAAGPGGATPGGGGAAADPGAVAEAWAWQSKLALHSKSGAVLPTIDNICVILENDPLLKDKFALNEFAGRGEVNGALPWNASTERRMWSDTDTNGLYWYIERAYDITKRANIDSALDIHASRHSFNEVTDYIDGLAWDGVARLDTLFIDYLGAEDCDYTRAVTRKAFTAAVARAKDPGCKYDNMLILCGAQGIGKSTLLDKMAKGWFNDSIRTFEGKEASELLQGVWIVEVAELDAFRRSDVSRIKQFLSLKMDIYRAAYGRFKQEFKRKCVFFGTCNETSFLQDTTGNRRFWPVDVGVCMHPKTVFADLTDDVVDQLWAEAKVRWQCGEQLYLSGAVEEDAKVRQELHREENPWAGAIEDFLNKPIPDDWLAWPINRRRDYWAGAVANGGANAYKLVQRDRVCPAEIWCECLGNASIKNLTRHDVSEINGVLANIPGWTATKGGGNFGPYGRPRGYTRDA